MASPDPREGASSSPTEAMIAHLQSWLAAKYRIDAAYRIFADRLQGPWRDSLAAHWAEHAGEERQQAYDLAMKIVGLGGDPVVASIEVPPCGRDVGSMCACLMELELQAIERAHGLIQMAGDLTSLRLRAEEIMLSDAHHLDDLRRTCVMAGTG